MAIGKKDRTVVVYYMNKSEPMRMCEMCAHDDAVTCLSFANKTLSFVSGGKDGRMNVWSVRGNKIAPTRIELFVLSFICFIFSEFM